MTAYRKKPVVVHAWQVPPPDDMAAYGRFAFNLNASAPNAGWEVIGEDGALYIATLEGVMRAEPGDWVIRGVKGEIYPCKPDIFEATYELADTPTPTKGPTP